MFFKARSQLFFGISKNFLIHHKPYPQDNHSLKFFVKKSWFSIFFSTIFFYQFCRQIFLTNIFHKKIILNGHFEGNAYAELKFFQKFWKKFISGLKKHCSGCFLKQPGSLFKQASIFSHRFHTQQHTPWLTFFLTKFFCEFYWQLFFPNFFDQKIILYGYLEGKACGETKFFLKFQKKFEIVP